MFVVCVCLDVIVRTPHACTGGNTDGDDKKIIVKIVRIIFFFSTSRYRVITILLSFSLRDDRRNRSPRSEVRACGRKGCDYCTITLHYHYYYRLRRYYYCTRHCYSDMCSDTPRPCTGRTPPHRTVARRHSRTPASGFRVVSGPTVGGKYNNYRYGRPIRV